MPDDSPAKKVAEKIWQQTIGKQHNITLPTPDPTPTPEAEERESDRIAIANERHARGLPIDSTTGAEANAVFSRRAKTRFPILLAQLSAAEARATAAEGLLRELISDPYLRCRLGGHLFERVEKLLKGQP